MDCYKIQTDLISGISEGKALYRWEYQIENKTVWLSDGFKIVLFPIDKLIIDIEKLFKDKPQSKLTKYVPEKTKFVDFTQITEIREDGIKLSVFKTRDRREIFINSDYLKDFDIKKSLFRYGKAENGRSVLEVFENDWLVGIITVVQIPQTETANYDNETIADTIEKREAFKGISKAEQERIDELYICLDELESTQVRIKQRIKNLHKEFTGKKNE